MNRVIVCCDGGGEKVALDTFESSCVGARNVVQPADTASIVHSQTVEHVTKPFKPAHKISETNFLIFVGNTNHGSIRVKTRATAY